MPEPRYPKAGISKRRKAMSTFKFAPVPSNSSVDGLVTLLVSAWFLVAAVLIFTDPASANRASAALAPGVVTSEATEVAIAPEARLTITVEAPRLKPSATL
jgi:hypothetical protein